MRPTTAILFCFALAACEKCALQDELPREQQARSWLAKGRAAVNKGDLAGAQQALEKAASYAPTDPEPQRTLGDVYEKLGQEAQAIFELTHELGGSLRLDQTLSIVEDKLRQLVPFDYLAVHIREGDVLKVKYVDGKASLALASPAIPVGQGLSGWMDWRLASR